jgi:hypothetical protein
MKDLTCEKIKTYYYMDIFEKIDITESLSQWAKEKYKYDNVFFPVDYNNQIITIPKDYYTIDSKEIQKLYESAKSLPIKSNPIIMPSKSNRAAMYRYAKIIFDDDVQAPPAKTPVDELQKDVNEALQKGQPRF